MEKPKVFISYAWTNQDFQAWVLSIAERLMDNGIEVVIDVWNLEPGQDKYVFMEKMVGDSSINHVLLILNEKYKIKADDRTGGVGTEAQIVSAELYQKTDQTKFIPIIAERNTDGTEFTPLFLKNRIYVDLSIQADYEKEYEKLLRFIYKRPQFAKPKLGTPPSFLFDDKENDADMKLKEKMLVKSIEKGEKDSLYRLKEYLKELSRMIDTCRLRNIDGDHITFGKIAYEKYIEMTVYRDSFLKTVKIIAIYGEMSHFEELFLFYTNIDQFYRPKENTHSSWKQDEYDNFALFFYELIISMLAILITFEKYEMIKHTLSHILIDNTVSHFMFEPIEKRMKTIYDKFKDIISIGEYYKSITGQNYFQPIVEILKTRIFEDISLSDIVEADLLLHYYHLDADIYNQYYPRFAIYVGSSNLKFFLNLIYKDKIENILKIFNCSTKDELIAFLEGANFDYKNTRVSDRQGIPRLNKLINSDLWGTK